MDQVQIENKTEQKNIPQQNTPVPQNPISTPAPAENQPETDQEINWRKFKEARALERKQAEEMTIKAEKNEAEARALKAALDAVLNKSNQNQNDSFDEDETEDQRIEKKVNALIAKRESEAERKRMEQEQTEYPHRLKNTHKDFDQICSSSNLDYLEYHHPELAKSLASRPQGFEKWNDIYSAIKRYVPNTDSRKDQSRAESNFNKPQSISSPSITQNGNNVSSSRLDEARKAENWARMQKLIKGIS